ncbi:MAG: carboxylate--amine ligase [Actinobacteria bacterium]|nr:MAG: carboxylate--amine ligase [Actinomycetota bacterium]
MRWDFIARPEVESVDMLRKMGATLTRKHGARPILLTCSDWFAVFIERHSDALAECFQFPKPNRSVVAKLLNKWEMYVLARGHDVPAPVTARPSSGAEIDDFVAQTGFPLVLKPADPFLPDRPPKAIVRSRPELKEAVRYGMKHEPWNFVMQEYIPGGVETVWMCNGYFGTHGSQRSVFTGRKLRQVSSTGVASFAVCAQNDIVASQTYRFMSEVGYRGCVGIGYRHDARDGQYKLLDVNARVSSIFRLFAGANDLDVVRLCYLDLSGQPVPGTTAQEGRKWLLERDIKAVVSSRTGERVGVCEWLRSLRGVQELHWFARDDVRPFGAWLGHEMFRK